MLRRSYHWNAFEIGGGGWTRSSINSCSAIFLWGVGACGWHDDPQTVIDAEREAEESIKSAGGREILRLLT